ncbi:MAG TPA: alpha/beta fold hydrolase [Casimicrobiaceae bacterium]|nr:alpha/beta fold hydrolase [Casimicrobiaceae bacterium]
MQRLPGLSVLHRAALVATVSALLGVGACSDGTRTRTIDLAECRLPRVAQAVQCGRLEVPENRTHPDGRKLSIFVAVLPANTLSPKPDPLVLLAGGPGQAASTLGPFAMQLAAVRRTRDILLIDQRGTGRSSPLDCRAFAPDEHAEFDIDPVPKSLLCAWQLAEKHVDASQYTTAAWVADLDAVREALGYRQWNLWGGSYGTRVAQEYVRRHPEQVRSVVLDGVAPPSMRISFDVWRTRDDALDGVIAACRASPLCAKAHPDPDATLRDIEHALDGGKTIMLRDPRTGITRDMHIDFETVIGALQPLTYAPDAASLIPELLALAHEGDFAPLFAASLVIVGDLPEQFSPALHYSVTCAEDVPRVTRAERANGVDDERVRALARRTLAVCDQWPKGSFDGDFAQPLRSNVPTLLLSGGLDPVTPPAYGDEVARTLPHSRHIVARGFGHIVSPHACAPRLIAAFVDEAGFTTLPKACIDFFEHSHRPPSWPDRLAPVT